MTQSDHEVNFRGAQRGNIAWYESDRYQQCKFRPGALGTPVYAEIHRAGHHSSDVGERLFQIAVKIAVFAPMPSARASTATMVNRGVFVSVRNA